MSDTVSVTVLEIIMSGLSFDFVSRAGPRSNTGRYAQLIRQSKAGRPGTRTPSIPHMGSTGSTEPMLSATPNRDIQDVGGAFKELFRCKPG